MKNIINKISNHQNKIFYDLDELNKALEGLRNKKIVFTGGVFDLFHFGHLNYLERSKALGDILIVHVDAFSPDASRRDKYDRPILPEDKKAAIIASLDFVDFVIVQNRRSYDDILLDKIKPNVFVRAKRVDQTEEFRIKRIDEFKEKYPFMKMVYLETTAEISTTQIIEKIRSPFLSENTKDSTFNNLIDIAKRQYENGNSNDVNRIGAVVVSNKDIISTGRSIYCKNPSLSMCGERISVYNAVSDGANKVKIIVVYTGAVPSTYSMCGQCRQVIYEFSDPKNPTKIILANDSSKVLVTDINKLLPMAFKSNRSRTTK